jgi:hypothetical protein
VVRSSHAEIAVEAIKAVYESRSEGAAITAGIQIRIVNKFIKMAASPAILGGTTMKITATPVATSAMPVK